MKLIFWFVPALLAGMLAGCAPGRTSGQAEATPIGLHVLDKGDETGCYLPCSRRRTGSRLLGYVDYQSLTAAPLCRRAGCTHSSADCTAFFPAEETLEDVWVLDADCLLLSTWIAGDTDSRHAFYLADRQTGSRRQLFCSADCLPETDRLLADGDSLYFVAAFGEEGRFLCELSLSDGSLEKRFSLSHLQSLAGVLDGRILSLVYDWTGMEALVQPPSAAPEASDKAWQKPDGITGNRWLRLVDPKGKSHGCAGSWQEETTADIRSFVSDQSRVWWMDLKGQAGFWDADGNAGELQVNWPFVPTPEEQNGLSNSLLLTEGFTLLQNHLLVTALRQDTIHSPLLYFRYSVDLSTGEVQEIPLYYVANGVRLPVDLVAQSHGQLLVRIFSAMRTTPAIGMYGEPFSSYEQTDRLGLIAPEDFLAGLPRYQEIETSYHWFIN